LSSASDGVWRQPRRHGSKRQGELPQRFTRGRRDWSTSLAIEFATGSIRVLGGGRQREVVKDLKPVWLMSPLSVSDTLAARRGPFRRRDLRRASQIHARGGRSLALFRARQGIVVGDEISFADHFFAARRGRGEDDDADGDDAETAPAVSRCGLDLEANSFLITRRGTCLHDARWHYRSRSESLISFSNWRFYDGRLLTVPEENLPRSAGRRTSHEAQRRPGHRCRGARAAGISFHLLERASTQAPQSGEADTSPTWCGQS